MQTRASQLCWFGFAIALGFGCGGTTQTGQNNGNGPITPVPATTLPTVPIATEEQIQTAFGTTPQRSVMDLSGIWDLVGARVGRTPEYGLLAIDRGTLVFVDGWGNGVAVTGLPDAPVARTLRRGVTHSLFSQHTPQAVSMGQLPIQAGGTWSFMAQQPGDSGLCTGTLLPAQITANCQSVSGIPKALPLLNGAGSALRVAPLPSIFGDLGGEWELNGQNSHCSAKVNGNVFTATCDKSSGFTGGSMTLVFGDGVASGTTSKGIEVAARRR